MHLVFLCTLVWSCQTAVKEQPKAEDQTQSTPETSKVTFQNKGHELVYNMVQTVGDYEQLKALKDVTYKYTYQTPDNKADISMESYIFDGELSYGSYYKHERTFPELEGKIEQGFDGDSFWFKHNGELLNEEVYQKRSTFSRKTNFYWFTMMQKLLDPGLNYEYLKEETIDAQTYDVVKVSFDSEKPTDIYQLYINKKTHLVDQFLFTVADFNSMDPRLMKVVYEKVEGILIPNKRKYTKSDWNGVPLNDQWNVVEWTDIKFDNGLSIEMFQ
ncbi:MAG: FIG00649640: hypothetical protein [uncultured Aureispira sp.]|uniref:Uncharacterized protein n=1 Tax=uncultured Aureispira sp. TaxID=1331704 RepID=A0A6S6TZZ3_9BACT|nr:MAG: FIG00649640: hypothetical protein [uncultured Aureispira sp.]